MLRPVHTSLALTVLFILAVELQSPVCAENPPPSFAGVRVEGIEVANIDTDGIDVHVFVSQAATQSATLRKLIFENVMIDDVRIQVQPLNGPIHLRANEPGLLPSPISARVSYRELESLEPLRRAISLGRARIQATLRAELQLNIFQQIALRGGGAWVITDVEQTVPVATPGGTLGRWSAMATLLAAEPLWKLGHAASEWRRSVNLVGDVAQRSAAVRLVVLETRYNLQSRTGDIVSRRNVCSGFLAGDDHVLAPAEVAEPWLYDLAIAEAIHKKDVQVERDSVEILATLLRDSSRSASSKKKQIHVSGMPRGREHAMSATEQRYRVRFRNSNANAVVLRIEGWKDVAQDRMIEASAKGWQPAVVMRTYGAGTQPSPWLTEVKIQNGRLQLKHPAEPAAFGSPVWVEDGIAGMLQDEQSGTPAAWLTKKLH